MKILKSASQFIVLFLIALFASCTYEPIDGTVSPDPDTVGTVNSGIFKADFSGKTWTANEVQATVSGNFIEISAIKANGEGFGLMIEGSTVGTYAANINILTFVPARSEYGYWSLNDDNPAEDTGSITITSINTTTKTISGTFKFKGYWSDPDTPKAAINFTNGVFKDIPYTTQEESTDVFSAKVGGTNFVANDIFTATFGSGTEEWITIGAEDGNSNSISISLKSNLTDGTYLITGNVATDVIQASYLVTDIGYEASSGNVKITSITADRVKGTFQFTTNGTTPFIITEGNFDVEY